MFHRHLAKFCFRPFPRNSLGYIFILLFSFLIVSCAVLSKAESIPNTDVPAKNINTYIKLNDDPVLENSHKNGDILNLEIINLSQSNIVFPENYHAQAFKKENGEWVKIGNPSYNAGDKFLLPPEDVYPLGLMVTYLPSTYITEPTTIRVSIDGYLEGNEQTRVGAYLDFQLKP